MPATQLFDLLTARGCRLLQDGEHLRIQDPQHALTDALRQAIRQHKAALLAILTQPIPVNDAPAPAPSTQEAHVLPSPIIEERWDLPPCRQCGGRMRWLNAGLVPTARWFMHCAQCSPPPTQAASAPGEQDLGWRTAAGDRGTTQRKSSVCSRCSR